MIMTRSGDIFDLPPPERGRSVREADRMGVARTRFDRRRSKTALARRLRRDSTNVEMRLWQKLRNRQRGVDFRRQHPIGPYIWDFYCPPLRLAIERDGGQHSGEEATRYDNVRTCRLATRDLAMLRFWYSDVTENLLGVLEDLATKIAELQSTRPLPARCAPRLLPFRGR
ncbi:MAG TPA: endonuclease domain-containing protein [Xanthobacteraceae bacterium]|nr:endonuclease domain-containing protein [Xanthobacteraceae bacterium]